MTVHCQRQEPVEVHLRQSDIDGACAHHCLAMVLIILGLVKRSAVLDMAKRRYGVAANLYTVLADHWMDGTWAAEVVTAIERLDLPLVVKWADGFNSGVDAFAVDALQRGLLVMLAYQSEKDRHRHFVVGIGCGGIMEGRAVNVDSLMVLDPSSDDLPFAVGNGALRLVRQVDFSRRKSSVRWRYESLHGAEPVRLMSAISLRLRTDRSSKRRL